MSSNDAFTDLCASWDGIFDIGPMGQPKPEPPWNCEHCDRDQPPKARRCTDCGAPRPRGKR